MKHTISKRELAGLLGVAGFTIDDSGMPVLHRGAGNGMGGPEPQWTISRNALALSWGVHVDTLSKWATREGLGAAILRRKAKGEIVFDKRLAWRWKLAYEGALNQLTLDDFQAHAKRGLPAVGHLSFTHFIQIVDDPKPAKRKKQPQPTPEENH